MLKKKDGASTENTCDSAAATNSRYVQGMKATHTPQKLRNSSVKQAKYGSACDCVNRVNSCSSSARLGVRHKYISAH